MIEPGNLYRHFKGGIYYVHFLARSSESEEQSVVYQKANFLENGEFFLGPERPWYRPLDNFCESVEIDGQMVNRFELIEG